MKTITNCPNMVILTLGC